MDRRPQTARRALPLRRRERTTRRPVWLRMRTRKPETRLRLRLVPSSVRLVMTNFSQPVSLPVGGGSSSGGIQLEALESIWISQLPR